MIQRSKTAIFSVEWAMKRQGTLFNRIHNTVVDRASQVAPAKLGSKIIKRHFRRNANEEPNQLNTLEKACLNMDRESTMNDLIYSRGGGYYIDIGSSKHIGNGDVKVKSGVTMKRFTSDRLLSDNNSEVEGRCCDDLAGRLAPLLGLDAEREIRGMMKRLDKLSALYRSGGFRARFDLEFEIMFQERAFKALVIFDGGSASIWNGHIDDWYRSQRIEAAPSSQYQQRHLFHHLLLLIMSGESLESASQVCWNCKIKKRKCTKDLPSCALCSRLLLKCEYNYSSYKSVATITPKSEKSSEPRTRSSSPSASTPILHASANLLAAISDISLGSPKFSSIGIEADISAQIAAIIARSGETIPTIIASYFRTVDTWLPIISRENLQFYVDNANPIPIAHSSLLLCMSLAGSTSNTVRSSIYTAAKALHSLLISSGNVSIEVVQAALLVCIYEQGHGIPESSQTTIAVCSRLGHTLINNCRKMGAKEIQNTEIGRLCENRYINLGALPEDIFFSAGRPSSMYTHVELPTDNTMPKTATLPVPRTPSGVISGLPATRFGPFCRCARSAYLLGQTLEFIELSSVRTSVDENEVATLDSSLQDLGMDLVRYAVNGWEECCAAIGLCFSSILVLHKRVSELPNIPESRKEMAFLTMKSATRMVIDICHRFQIDLNFIEISALPLPATFCIYQATLLHIQLSGDEFLRPTWISDMHALKTTLAHFAQRWDIANKYLELIEVAIEDRRQSRRDNLVQFSDQPPSL
ncbi:hypothetical protein B7494_g878 [Chlorociboria aeruginascens]|nr:hypothetical protein B7494_g878 [Chlorociboria aeruginascens]